MIAGQLKRGGANSLDIRSALTTACSALLAVKPIEAISVDAIVDAAGVAKGSFYNHFRDKNELAAVVSNLIREKMERSVRVVNQNVTDSACMIARGICTYVGLAIDNPRQAMVMLRAQNQTTDVNSPLNKQMHTHILQGVLSERFSPRCTEVAVLQVMGTTTFTMAQIIAQRPTRVESAQLASQAITLTLCGFGVPEHEAASIAEDSTKEIIDPENGEDL